MKTDADFASAKVKGGFFLFHFWVGQDVLVRYSLVSVSFADTLKTLLFKTLIEIEHVRSKKYLGQCNSQGV
jgi:hypothetical protein